MTHVVAYIGVALLVIVTVLMFAGVVWWIRSWIQRRNRGW